jgi:hypothetical protein
MLYVAPNTGRFGMLEFENALKMAGIVCVEKCPTPDE